MKRHSRKIITAVIVFPLLGAIVNVAVAWGCAAWIPLNIGGTHDSRFASRWYAEMKNVPSMPKQELETITQIKNIGFRADELVSVGWRRERAMGYEPVAFVFQAGWPCRTAVGGILIEVGLVERRRSIDLIELRSFTPHPQLKRQIPTDVIWPGFAINTIFYAAILWVVFFAPGAFRRIIRRRRGLCAHAGTRSAHRQSAPNAGSPSHWYRSA